MYFFLIWFLWFNRYWVMFADIVFLCVKSDYFLLFFLAFPTRIGMHFDRLGFVWFHFLYTYWITWAKQSCVTLIQILHLSKKFFRKVKYIYFLLLHKIQRNTKRDFRITAKKLLCAYNFVRKCGICRTYVYTYIYTYTFREPLSSSNYRIWNK
jgi:hypothetical protein